MSPLHQVSLSFCLSISSLTLRTVIQGLLSRELILHSGSASHCAIYRTQRKHSLHYLFIFHIFIGCFDSKWMWIMIFVCYFTEISTSVYFILFSEQSDDSQIPSRLPPAVHYTTSRCLNKSSSKKYLLNLDLNSGSGMNVQRGEEKSLTLHHSDVPLSLQAVSLFPLSSGEGREHSRGSDCRTLRHQSRPRCEGRRR